MKDCYKHHLASTFCKQIAAKAGAWNIQEEHEKRMRWQKYAPYNELPAPVAWKQKKHDLAVTGRTPFSEVPMFFFVFQNLHKLFAMFKRGLSSE